MTENQRRLREELNWLKSRYDSDKVSPAVFIVIKKLERDIAWDEHEESLK
jgi:hypothetical protein